MDIPLRKILGLHYPEQFAAGKLKKIGGLFGENTLKRLIIVLLVVFILTKLALLFFYYNVFLSMQYDVEEAQAQINAQLQRRKNIILNLNVMVVSYAKHEEAMFKYAANTRKEMIGLGSDATKAGRGANLDALLSNVMAVAEQYPELRLSENFQRFMDALVDVETKIAEQRMIYNERANDLSTALGKFPGFLFAKMYGFENPEFFKPEDEAREPPRIAGEG